MRQINVNTMVDYLDQMNEQEDSLNVQEPVIAMNVQQTTGLLEKHYDSNASVENGMSLQEGFDLLRSRIETKVYEKNRIVS